jgi:hypothetical protein
MMFRLNEFTTKAHGVKVVKVISHLVLRKFTSLGICRQVRDEPMMKHHSNSGQILHESNKTKSQIM